MILVFCLSVLAVFGLGTLVIAVVLHVKHNDTRAAYPLFAVRDALIESVVFKEVPRNDPWVESLYEGLNGVLKNSNLVAGPDGGWERATYMGVRIARNPSCARHFPEFPDSVAPPEQLAPVLEQLGKAIEQFIQNHHGIKLQWNTAARVKAQEQRRRAEALRAQVTRATLRVA